ncbi:MAG: hypothetical protein M0C28_24020 [Candidatus Moduliflexus flocculans]|nr:hypothetical protein [Candidatus Moduliflexus flocculans]
MRSFMCMLLQPLDQALDPSGVFVEARRVDPLAHLERATHWPSSSSPT